MDGTGVGAGPVHRTARVPRANTSCRKRERSSSMLRRTAATLVVAIAARARAGGHGERAPARELHDEPLRRSSCSRATAAYVVYVLDLAEIPTFQAKSRGRKRGPESLRGRLAGHDRGGPAPRVDGARRPPDAARAHSRPSLTAQPACGLRASSSSSTQVASSRAGARALDPRRHLRGPARLARDRDPAPSAARRSSSSSVPTRERSATASARIPRTCSRARSTCARRWPASTAGR